MQIDLSSQSRLRRRVDSMGKELFRYVQLLRLIFEKHVGPIEGDCSIQVIRKNWGNVQLFWSVNLDVGLESSNHILNVIPIRVEI